MSDQASIFENGWYQFAQKRCSPNFNQRPLDKAVSAIIVHCISLPCGSFGQPYIDDLFMGCIDCCAHPDFDDLQGVEVSSHFLIDRDGSLKQYVSVGDRAWHAGESCFKGVPNVNDYSVGIELEGVEDIPFTDQQYDALAILVKDLVETFNIPLDNIVGHSDIAPGRKTDPGEAFDWLRFKQGLEI